MKLRINPKLTIDKVISGKTVVTHEPTTVSKAAATKLLLLHRKGKPLVVVVEDETSDSDEEVGEDVPEEPQADE